jgi:multicomponent Na+:H+ antiporter subunit D
VAALTSAALLRATGRVFLGLGAPAATPGRTGDHHRRAHPTQVAPAVGLLVVAVLVGLAPGLTGAAHHAAERFTDRPGYAAAVLEGASGAGPGTAHPPPELAGPALWAVVSALLGLGLALAALRPDRLPARLRDAVTRLWDPVAGRLRDLHHGGIGDSVTWLVVGMAAFGTLLALVVR